MIPMRRVFVVNAASELKYPEGVACAAVLEAGETGDEQSQSQAMGVVRGALFGAVFKLCDSFFSVVKGTLETAWKMGDSIFFLGGDVSPALVAVGVIVRLNISLLIFIGGAIGWLISIPMLGEASAHESALDGAWTLWSTKVRYIGVGAMVVGGIDSIFKVRFGLMEAIKHIVNRSSDGKQGAVEDSNRDIPSGLIVALTTLAILGVAWIYYGLTESLAITVPATVIMVIMAFFFTAVASYIVGLVGNSNSPVSGMTITAVLFTGGMLMVFGFSGEQGMVATLGVAAVVCCAACTSGDVCNDLKTGHMVGASPFRQQIMQIIGVSVASVVMAPVLQLLHDNTPGGIGGRELAAPQAGLFASLAEGFFGDGQIPKDMVLIGAVIGVAILIIDAILKAKETSFRAHLMPIAVGIYLPFALSLPILAGGLMAHFIVGKTKDEGESDRKMQRGVLFASGVIAGESLVGVGIALLAAGGISRMSPELGESLATGLTFAAVAIALGMFWKNCRNQN